MSELGGLSQLVARGTFSLGTRGRHGVIGRIGNRESAFVSYVVTSLAITFQETVLCRERAGREEGAAPGTLDEKNERRDGRRQEP